MTASNGRPEFSQSGADIRLEWAREGLDAVAPDCGAVVIVDVLSFSTSVDVAVARGARVLPLPMRRNDPEAAARATAADAILAGPKNQGGWSLSPSSLVDIPADTALALPSPNGATLSARAAEFDGAVFAGSLRNATSVADAAAEAAGSRPIAIIPAGERWGIVDGPLRPSVEDYLGAGAIARALIGLRGNASIEAQLAATAFESVAASLAATLSASVSGRELIGAGLQHDVELASALDVSTAAPRLIDGFFSG